MKKLMFLFLTSMLLLILSSTVIAATTFDTGEVNTKGIIKVSYDGKFDKSIKVRLQKAGETSYVVYDLKTANAVIPLTSGNGVYSIIVMQHVKENSYLPIAKLDNINAEIKDMNAMYTYSTPLINFSSESEAIKGYSELLKTITGIKEKVDGLYNDVVKNYTYDHDKAKKVAGASGYLPNIDSTYKDKKGICFDYSALMAAVGRSMGVPIKLVMGYAPEISSYHAWNEILYDGKWIVVDTTYDAAFAQVGQKYTMIKDASLFKVEKVY